MNDIRVIVKYRTETGKMASFKLDSACINKFPDKLEYQIYWIRPHFEILAITPDGEKDYGVIEYEKRHGKYVVVKNTTPFDPPQGMEDEEGLAKGIFSLAMDIYTELLERYRTYLADNLEEAIRKMEKQRPLFLTDKWAISYIVKRKTGYYKGQKIYSSFKDIMRAVKSRIKESPVVIFGYATKRRGYFIRIVKKRITYCVYNRVTEKMAKEHEIESIKEGLELMVKDAKKEHEIVPVISWNRHILRAEIEKVEIDIDAHGRRRIITEEKEVNLHDLYRMSPYNYIKLTLFAGDRKLLEVEWKDEKRKGWGGEEVTVRNLVCTYIDPELKKIVEKYVKERRFLGWAHYMGHHDVILPWMKNKYGEIVKFSLELLFGLAYTIAFEDLRKRPHKRSIHTLDENIEGLTAPQSIPTKEGVISVRVIRHHRGIEYHDLYIRGKGAKKKLEEVIKSTFAHKGLVVLAVRPERHVKVVFTLTKKRAHAVVYDMKTGNLRKKEISPSNVIGFVLKCVRGA